jgi:ankyrin repeat protein
VVKLLLAKGASVDQATTDEYKMTPLYSASDNSHSEVVKLLLDQGANININAATPT